MRNIYFVVKYEGTRYLGWQRQKNSEKTIQGKIESVLSKMTNEDIVIVGASRTDAGVHALMQVANFQTNSFLTTEEMIDYCYQYLPRDIVIKEMQDAHERFHSRFNVKSKSYLYKINTSKYHDVFNDRFCHHIREQINIGCIKEDSK